MLVRGERYKIEISEERYDIHKDGDTDLNMTIEIIEGQWGVFILKRAFRSFHGKFYADLELMREVSDPEEGKKVVYEFGRFLENVGLAKVRTQEYYKKN